MALGVLLRSAGTNLNDNDITIGDIVGRTGGIITSAGFTGDR